MELGARLKKLRDEKGISQLELAKALNISNVMLSRYEKNKRSPDYETLNKLADFYDVTTDYLLGRTNSRNPQIQQLAADAQAAYENLPAEIYEHIKIIMQYFIDEEKKHGN
ncbi:MAG: helix-turn-helix transcriptional regulator [Bacillota bacterium]